MSKWNVKTTDGRIADVKAIASPPLPSGDLEASNPKFTGASNSSPLYADYVDADTKPGFLKKCGGWLETRRGRIFAFCCIFWIIAAAVLIAVLFPRIPTVVINKTETAQNMNVENLGNGSYRVTGNITMIINNNNVYPISMAGMDISGAIGHNVSNQLHFTQSIGALDIAGNGNSRHILPMDLPIPPDLDLTALLLDIAKDCLDNTLTSIIQGTAKINVLGTIVSFSFGPQTFDSRCIGN